MQLDFVGVGAARCGTTWLARCLGEHPRIFLPARKELHFFGSDQKYEPELRWLRPHFETAPSEALRGEFTPRYLIQPVALERIARHFPETRILALLRDPVDRAWSQHQYFRRNKKKENEADFERALTGFYSEDYIDKGLYADQLERLFGLFDRDRIWIGLYDDIRQRPSDLLCGLFAFLGVDPDFRPSLLDRVVNRSGGIRAEPGYFYASGVKWLTHTPFAPVRRHRGRILAALERRHERAAQAHPGDARPMPPEPSLSPETARRVFVRHFADQVERTETLTGLDLSDWKR